MERIADRNVGWLHGAHPPLSEGVSLPNQEVVFKNERIII